MIPTNKVTLSGCIASNFNFSHEVFGEKFYTVYIAIKRSSEAVDLLPVLFSERIINVHEDYTNEPICITGQFRSYNMRSSSGNRLILHVFAMEYQWLETVENINTATLEGYLCRKSFCRDTPLGRKIADVILAVHRPYGKSDYLPCICWGRNAIYAEKLDVGSCIRLTGRIQSREYTKKIGENETTKTAYEFSVSKLDVIE